MALFCLCPLLSQAQTLKFGHINVQELIDLMPERDSVIVQMQKYYEGIQETFAGIQNELQTKYTEYQQKSATWSSIILETKQQAINELSQRLESFRESAPQDMEQTQNMLYAPVYQKATDAIKKVGKDLGLIYIFNSASMPYIDEDLSMNLLDKVKAELKIPAEKVAPSMIGG